MSHSLSIRSPTATRRATLIATGSVKMTIARTTAHGPLVVDLVTRTAQTAPPTSNGDGAVVRAWLTESPAS